MNAEQNKQAIKDAWRTFATRDFALVAALFTPDAEWLAPPGNATAIALGGESHMRGPEAIASFICRDFGRLFPGKVNLDFRGIHAEGDVVVLEERMTAGLAGGGTYTNDYCFVYTLREGKIANVREYMDTLNGHIQIFGPVTQLAGVPA